MRGTSNKTAFLLYAYECGESTESDELLLNGEREVTACDVMTMAKPIETKRACLVGS
jgi:hypothetical protein